MKNKADSKQIKKVAQKMTANQTNNLERRGVLYLISGPASKEAVKLRRDSTIFGREKGDVVINDHEISSTHFQIQNINNDYHIFDMNSTNGTFVNKKRTIRAKLESGDTISIGQTTFKFMIEEEAHIRHISTLFGQGSKDSGAGERKVSMVDTMIEHQLREARQWSILIQVTYKNGMFEEIQVDQRTAFIGRASSFGQFDKDTETSRKHLMIKVNEQGEIFVEDQGSTNGSLMNGVKIQGLQRARPSDVIRVGLSTFSLQSIENEE